MTKDEFAKLHEIHVKCWMEIYRDDLQEKPEGMKVFKDACVACDISAQAAGDGEYYCCYCPADEWRKEAEELRDNEMKVPPICESGSAKVAHFGRWAGFRQRHDIPRRDFALKIARMHWSYLPEYEGIEVQSKWLLVGKEEV
jgi:hypothetical protein